MYPKRPLLWITSALILGEISGIGELMSALRLISCFAFLLLFSFLFFSGPSKAGPPRRARRLALFLLFLFLLGAARSSTVYRFYAAPDQAAFFSSYAPRNEGEFDYGLYLKGQTIPSARTRPAQRNERQNKTENGQENRQEDAFHSFRVCCSEILQAALSEKDAGIYHALLLGDKSQMDERVRSLYQSQGIAHLLAVSGLHLSMIGMGACRLLRKIRLGPGLSGLLSSLLILCYGFLTGAQSSAMRAVIMLLARFLSLWLGTSYDTLSALSLAALLLAFANPYALLQSGFQLSFCAILSISLLGDSLIRAVELSRTGKHSAARAPRDRRVSPEARLPAWQRSILISLCIQFFTLPVILYHFYLFPLYGIFLNFLVIPLMTFVIASGLLVLFFGLLEKSFVFLLSACVLPEGIFTSGLGYAESLPEFICELLLQLSKACGGAGHYILLLYERLCEYSASLPHSALVLGQPRISEGLLYYGLMAILFSFFFPAMFSNAPQEKKRADFRNFLLHFSPGIRCGTFFLTLLLCAAGIFTKAGPSELTVKAIDVGQGDGFLIRFRDQDILIDAGSSSEKELGKYTLRPFLLSQGISELDAVYISHNDLDHTSGFLYLCDEVPEVSVRRLVLPKAAEQSEAYDPLKKASGYTDGISFLSCGDRSMISPDIRLLCLYEGRAASAEANAHSPVLLLEYGDFSMLFTGDMTKEDEALLARELREQDANPAALNDPSCPGAMPLTVYKAAHHGSKTSNSDALLKLFFPRYALISCSSKNSYGHPHREVTDRFSRYGTKLLQTKESGQINLKTDGKQLWIETPFSPPP